MNPLDATLQAACPTVMVPRYEELTLLNDSVERADISDYQQAAQDLTDFRPEIRVSRTQQSANDETR